MSDSTNTDVTNDNTKKKTLPVWACIPLVVAAVAAVYALYLDDQQWIDGVQSISLIGICLYLCVLTIHTETNFFPDGKSDNK